MLHQREGEKLDGWLSQVKVSKIDELLSFTSGIEKDKAAVRAGLTLLQNNGLVEGKVNKQPRPGPCHSLPRYHRCWIGITLSRSAL
jgi:hypothetical protein